MSERKACSVDGCEKPYSAKGMCRMHYTRVQRHGSADVRLPNGKPRPVSNTIELHVPHRPEGECWIWIGHLDKRGYGVVHAERPTGKRGPARAHRVIYEYLAGPIPEGMLLMHSCDNPPCVNPAHLRPGTDADNLGDMAAKGRSLRGERQRCAKLKDEQVLQVVDLASKGSATKDLALKFGVMPTTISAILHGRSWSHVTGFPKVKVNRGKSNGRKQ